jgi:hypothetical protein
MFSSYLKENSARIHGNWLMLFREIIAIYFANHTLPIKFTKYSL